jgi:hypothetical protein
MGGIPNKDLKWSTSNVRWVKSDSVFIAFSSKADEDDLIGDLQGALEDWNPAPSRLFLAKLRAEMDEYGVPAQTAALERKHALAHWYAKLLRADGDERRWMIAESIERHSDQLLNSILKRVETFASELVEAEAEAAGDDVEAKCKDHFNVDLTKDVNKAKAEREHNAFVCSKPPYGWHLTTGHVFTMKSEYWVCLSPACDLVPGQAQQQSRNASFGNRVPFVGVKLHPIGENKAVDANSNLFVFLNIGDEVKAFCFNDQRKEGTSPFWKFFFAEKRGKFHDGFEFKVSTIESGKRRLVAVVEPAEVVAQLRYEYAINLMQKLGISLTRIGLDFAGNA